MDNQLEDEAREARRLYMREYKRKKYAENSDEILAKNRAYYCRKTQNVPENDAKRLGQMLPVVRRVKAGLEQLRLSNPELFREILDGFLEPN
jgi:hypothetical protein